jgi:nickel superoxide dismutase
MKRTALALSLALAVGLALAHATPITTPLTTPGPAFHCQVPCGVYGDRMRVDMLMEDAATIEKGMAALRAMDAEAAPSKNQMVRWVMNKDSHAQAIQDQVASYWLAQRVKVPADGNSAARDKYHRQLEHLHRITVAAMKCKQTTEGEHVEAIKKLALEFAETYFSAEDLAHIRAHHAAEKH